MNGFCTVSSVKIVFNESGGGGNIYKNQTCAMTGHDRKIVWWWHMIEREGNVFLITFGKEFLDFCSFNCYTCFVLRIKQQISTF